MTLRARYRERETPLRSVDELIAELIEGASALVAMAEKLNPEAVTAGDIAAADATLVGLARVLGELRRARHDP